MIRIWVCLALAACGHGSGGGDPEDRCAQARFGQCEDGLQCTFPSDGGRPTFCDCQAGFFVCNSCDSAIMPPGGACTPGDSCDWNSWEHGCACGCGSDGQWSCAPETIGTTECGHPDAGIDGP